MPYFNSTAIRRAEYDTFSRTLTIWFTSGPQGYDYYNVPPDIYAGLLSAGSKGTFFNHYIRDKYAA